MCWYSSQAIRTPIIKENDDLATIVVDSLMAAKESEGFEFKDRDVVAVTKRLLQFQKVIM